MTTQLRTPPIRLPPPVGGLVEGVSDANLAGPGTITEGSDFVPDRAPRLVTRGGSRILLTLHDDSGAPAVVSHVLGLAPKAATGAVAISWSSGTTKHYATAVTSDIAFAGANEAASRTAFPATWNRATPARPVWALLFEKLYVCDANKTYGSRNPFVSIDAVTPPGFVTPTFEFVAGGAAAAALFPYCLEDYNNVLFIAGYGDEEAAGGDKPALLRHSFLGKAPDAADGFDKDGYNTIGSQGDRITGLKKGRGLLLIAKANELYRLTGFGRAYPGFQYQVEGVQNTAGFGVENPLALEQAEGFWFGIGKEGPFRTDGFNVESLVGPRQRSWRGIDNLDLAFVRYHPERRLMLFGVHVVAGAPDTTYPWVLWAWDMARNVWAPNWVLSTTPRLYIVQSVATTTSVGPTAPPTGPSTTLITASSYRANWTNGDATADTEFYERDSTGGGSWNLIAVIAAGTSLYNRTGRQDHNEYLWRVRHVKGGVASPYCADQSVKTLIVAPSVSGLTPTGFGGAYRFDYVNNAHGTVTADLLRDAVLFTSYGAQAGPNTVAYGVLVQPGHTWTLRVTDSTWTVTTASTSFSI